MFRRAFRAAVLGAALVALLASTVSASVAFEKGVGGFVGKGDVQKAYGWTNAELQENASRIGFYWDSFTQTTAEWTCTDLETGTSHVVSHGSSGGDTASYHTTVRSTKGKVTGFQLEEFDGHGGGIGGGPPLNECPSGEVLTTPGEDVTNQGGGLYVTGGPEPVLLVSRY